MKKIFAIALLFLSSVVFAATEVGTWYDDLGSLNSGSFNLIWHVKPKKIMTSWMTPGVFLKGKSVIGSFAEWYKGFPKLCTSV